MFFQPRQELAKQDQGCKIVGGGWQKFRQDYTYGKDIAFEDTVKVLYELLNLQDEVLAK